MSRLEDYIKNNIVAPTLNNKISRVMGTIIEYSEINNTAKVGYTHQNSGGMIEVDNVMVSIESPGIKGKVLSPGDEVMIEFINNIVPVVMKVIDKNYKNNTRHKSKHTRKGSYLPDSFCER